MSGVAYGNAKANSGAVCNGANAYLVLGAESSGTRLFTRILMGVGCAGDDGHEQKFDVLIPEANGRPIVWRRSFPHGGEWPKVPDLYRSLRDKDYEVRAVVMTRDWLAMRKSQIEAGHVAGHAGGQHDLETKALQNIREAYNRIFGGLHNADTMPYVMVSYEGLYQRPEITIRHTLDTLGWPGLGFEIVDGNEKWLS